MNRVLIVDDHESMSDSLFQALKNTNEFIVVGNLKSALHTEIYCMKLKPDLIFMDVCTEGDASGLAATKAISEKYANIKIIVMSGFDEVTYAPRAKEAGAQAFIYKSRSLDYFIQVAQGVMEGKEYFPQVKTIPINMGEAPLTEREIEILRLICKHMTNKEIADELFISEHTVKFHKSNMLAKTGFKKTVDLAFHMILKGLINPLY